MKTKHWQARTRDELIIEVWEALDCESVGERELLSIQEVLAETLGSGAVVSPAAIARVVADEGAALRHPEILNCDRKWRTQNSILLISLDKLNFTNPAEAAASLKMIDRLWREAAHETNGHKLEQLRELALHFKQEEQLLARSKIVTTEERSVAKEIAEWISIWLREPDLFTDWLDLRQRSPEYQRKFGK